MQRLPQIWEIICIRKQYCWSHTLSTLWFLGIALIFCTMTNLHLNMFILMKKEETIFAKTIGLTPFPFKKIINKLNALTFVI